MNTRSLPVSHFLSPPAHACFYIDADRARANHQERYYKGASIRRINDLSPDHVEHLLPSAIILVNQARLPPQLSPIDDMSGAFAAYSL
jgi:hypothetical protein